jgi:hypothetical protein
MQQKWHAIFLLQKHSMFTAQLIFGVMQKTDISLFNNNLRK